MRRYSDRAILRLGVLTLVFLALVMAATFNLGKLPGLRGTSYEAMFTDASGLHAGDEVLVGGIRVGRVESLTLDGSAVLITFSVDTDVHFGTDSRASIEVLNLLGEKYLNLQPAGPGQMSSGTPIALDHTQSAYDIVNVLGTLTTTTEGIDKPQLERAFNVLAQTTNSAAPEIRASFNGIAKLSQAVSSRDTEIRELFAHSRSVTKLLADRGKDLVHLMGDANKVFAELRKRRSAIHSLLVNARELAVQLRGVAQDNQKQMRPALRELNGLVETLLEKDAGIKATLKALGPYVSILSNIIGTGPWFNAYAVNLAAIPTGEFLPGQGPQ